MQWSGTEPVRSLPVLLFSLSQRFERGLLVFLKNFFTSTSFSTAVWLLPPFPVHSVHRHHLPCPTAKSYAHVSVYLTQSQQHLILLTTPLFLNCLSSLGCCVITHPHASKVDHFSHLCGLCISSSSAWLLNVAFPQDLTVCLLSQHILLKQSHSPACLPLALGLMTHQICISGRALSWVLHPHTQ